MPAHAVPIDIKEQGVTWLLPPYSWSIRHIARKLDLSPSVIARWRLELVQQGLLPENEKYLLSMEMNGYRSDDCKRTA
ncbi:helix-turn-helix domain-containing protein [Escherichia coli]|nr:helix-turn-helix domain-containing protein [Escherichia coli]EJW6769081.1 helix-turn-helix domain-containing protein [Escherichia coli]MED8836491.1 helix-turn-helix domain-containing protein [Escherichia coli]MED9641286.1 helix-turn-helix domain-containing protein [Escherichia coli]HAX9942171.1 helix-turn-helix domain-containing protein [Escherichia coli]